jgi:uncharacterized protein
VAAASSHADGNVNVYIVHGYCASKSDHWFAWLENELQKRGARVTVVDLPSPDDPKPQAWRRAIERQVLALDRNTYFVAHSLGGIALLNYLAGASTRQEIGGYILVAGFNSRLPTLPQLDGFITSELDYDRLIQITANRTVIAASDDATVPHALSRQLAACLDAKLIVVERGGHFLASDGFVEFPLLLEALAAQSGLKR